MTKNRFLMLILTICVGTAMFVVWFGSPKQEQSSSTTSIDTPSTESRDSESVATTSSESIVIETSAAKPLDAQISEPIETAGPLVQEPVNTETKVNPFTVNESAVATASNTPAITDNNQARAEETNAPGPRSAVIAVPTSFPVEDAAKYFIPRDQRRPGNLGGPPPLPNAATLQGEPPPGPGESPILPPPSPGQ